MHMNLKAIEFNTEEKKLIGLLEEAVSRNGQSAYLVGGIVRDKLLGRGSNDLDVVCVGDGIKLAHSFAKLERPHLPVAFFKRFGTAMVKWKEWEIEFVGARKESYSEDSRKPHVKSGTLEDDQNRRDFTINAMALSLNKSDSGTLIDPFNGMSDLKNKLIRTPLEPGITFSDDPLRMIRAVRFASQLDFEIIPEVKEAILENAHRMKIVSKERIMVEFQKIMMCDQPSIGIKLLEKLDLIPYVLPELADLKGVDEKNGIAHKDNFYHTLKVLDNISRKTQNLWLRWAALLHDIAKPATKRFEEGEGWTFHGHEILGASMVYEIFKKLKLPLDHKMKFVQKLVKLHLRPMALTKNEVTDSAIRRLLFDAGEDIDDLMILCRADITSKNEKKIKKYLSNYDLVINKLKEVEGRDKIRNWQPPVDGELIMSTFNLKPSKEVGIIKTAIREAILEGEIKNNYNDALAFMMEKGKEMGLKPTRP